MIFGNDHENEEFQGFDLDNIEEAEERYIRQLDVLNDFDSNIEFSEMGSSDKEEIDRDVDTVLADIAKWSDPLRPIEFMGPATVMENNKREIYFLIFCSRKHCQLKLLLKQISTHGSTLRQHQTKIGTQPIQRKSRLLLPNIGIQIVMDVLQPPAQDIY